MAEYKYLDKDGLLYVKGKLDTKLNAKVDKVSGKGLSTNDYTDSEQSKLSGIASGAQVNVIESIKVNGTAQTITSKAVNITVPTATSDLTNDSNFVVDANYVHTDNNFTTTLKNKLNGIDSGAQANKIESVEVNGDALTITGKTVNVIVPTNTNQLTNGAGFITGISSTDVTSALGYTPYNSTNPDGFTDNEGTVTSITAGTALTGGTISTSGTIAHSTAAGYKHIPTGGSTNQYLKYGGSSGTASWASPSTTVNSSSDDTTIPTSKAVMTAITNAVGGITGVAFEIVTTLPTTGNAGTIYLVSNSGSSPNVYDEYIYVSNAWEKIGTTDVDLSGYVQATELVAITNAEIDTIFA